MTTSLLSPGGLSRGVTGAAVTPPQVPTGPGSDPTHNLGPEAPRGPSNARLNWLRAGVLGANDGIVSVAAVVVGVAAVTANPTAIITAGMAALVGGALSMALGEYVSVSSARDSQLAAGTAADDEEISNPWHAGLASALAFVVGALLPFLAVLVVPGAAKIPATVVAVLIALALTGGLGARLGDAPVGRAVVRVLIGGALALGVTFAVGSLFGVVV
ncbi:VIT1/CCC1 transporter family protein [Serinibacter salmoneus]|uniref:VIT family protein n=1 Tax=Serinibacter salmoneus TaxID=556530 RepID=A0A2A9D2L5_9MICO|nr:VIT1/CCC1 transporter family protein [Serinibacter salmoneus]PFG20904.1 VIT family protein [Serinibacter salmoneus]